MSNQGQGIIIKIDSDKSWVLSQGETYKVDIKKTLLRSQQPMVGDLVHFEISDSKAKTGIIFNFEERKNFLPKPKIANIDQVFVITALRKPKFNSYLLNKYLLFLHTLSVKPILIFTKSDLVPLKADDALWAKINTYSQLGYQTMVINNQKFLKHGYKELKQLLMDKVSVFVGQTGAGKSTILNWFLATDSETRRQIKTQPISEALNRGKHTTTATELYPFSASTLVADTPGFGNFNIKEINLETLSNNPPLLKPYLLECGFPNCLHDSEASCSIKIEQIPKESRFIYDDYCRLINEIKTDRGKKKWKKLK